MAIKKKVVLIVMDGVGISPKGKEAGDAVLAAHTPVLDRLMKECPTMLLRAHGPAVGLPSEEDMGNSEVGHNALGCGQIYAQGAKLVNQSIESDRIFQSEAWQAAIAHARSENGALHFIGLLSDGNVHSHIDQVKALICQSKAEGIERVYLHALLDGRDVPPTSALTYIKDMEAFFASLKDAHFQAALASGGGRMVVTMDRYQADWSMVERGWAAHVHGQAPHQFANAEEAYESLRKETGKIDQDLPPFVLVRDGQPIGPVMDEDSVLFFNFRGDRAIEISMAFDDDDFPYFDRGRRPHCYYAGLLEYDGDLHIPRHYLVEPPQIKNTLTEFLVQAGVKEFACSETQKFGHVTYFWNGNRSEKFSEALEDWLEIPSDNVSFDLRPWMKSAEIADALIQAMEKETYGFLRVNFANGDMVGHTGVFDSVRIAIESVDLALKRILPVAKELGYTLLITADHGNSDDMVQKDKKTGALIPKTSHSLNPVPFILVDSDQSTPLSLDQDRSNIAGLANVAATVVDLMGLTPPAEWEPSLLKR